MPHMCSIDSISAYIFLTHIIWLTCRSMLKAALYNHTVLTDAIKQISLIRFDWKAFSTSQLSHQITIRLLAQYLCQVLIARTMFIASKCTIEQRF